MEKNTSFLNAMSLARTCQTAILCTFYTLLALSVNAQKRNPDLILTVKKDTMSVKIVEVDISDVKYRQLTDDTLNVHTILKTDILRVFYGNGDEEAFNSSTPERPVAPGRRYYQMVVKTPFQKEIAKWPTEKLILEKDRYKQKYLSQKIGGTVAFPVGGVLAVYGMAQAFASIFSFNNDDSAGGPAFISGIVIATGVGIPLSIFGSKNKKKYRAIVTELEVRGKKVE